MCLPITGAACIEGIFTQGKRGNTAEFAHNLVLMSNKFTPPPLLLPWIKYLMYAGPGTYSDSSNIWVIELLWVHIFMHAGLEIS